MNSSLIICLYTVLLAPSAIAFSLDTFQRTILQKSQVLQHSPSIPTIVSYEVPKGSSKSSQPSRRSLFSMAAGIAVSISLQAHPANAAETTSAGKVVTTKNKRLGGLANKIRGIGVIMVCCDACV